MPFNLASPRLVIPSVLNPAAPNYHDEVAKLDALLDDTEITFQVDSLGRVLYWLRSQAPGNWLSHNDVARMIGAARARAQGVFDWSAYKVSALSSEVLVITPADEIPVVVRVATRSSGESVSDQESDGDKSRAIGRWGEECATQALMLRYQVANASCVIVATDQGYDIRVAGVAVCRLNWRNKLAETQRSPDIIVETPSETIFYEVKASEGRLARVELSSSEDSFARQHSHQYRILLVSYARTDHPNIQERRYQISEAEAKPTPLAVRSQQLSGKRMAGFVEQRNSRNALVCRASVSVFAVDGEARLTVVRRIKRTLRWKQCLLADSGLSTETIEELRHTLGDEKLGVLAYTCGGTPDQQVRAISDALACSRLV